MENLLLAYLGPDTMLPMTSALATMGGFLLMFGKQLLLFVWKLVALLR